MQKHAIALGYFILAVFCILTSAHCFAIFSAPLIVGAMLALVAGLGYIAEPLGVGMRPLQVWIVEMIRLAQETAPAASVKNEKTQL